MTLEPLESMDVPNALARWFGDVQAPGTLSLETAESASVTMSARTYLRSSSAMEADRWLAGLAQSDSFTTDVEAFNASLEPQAFEASLFARSGALLGLREGLTLDAGQTREWGLRELFPEAVGEGLTVRISAAGGVLPTAHATITDLRTGSGWTSSAARPSERVYLPVAGRTAGGGDTYLSTDIALVNSGERSVAVTLRFLERDLENAAPPSTTFRIGPREGRSIEDVLGTLFGTSQVSGFLEIRADSPVIVATAVEAARADGIPGEVGVAVSSITPPQFSSRSVLRSSSAGIESLRVGLLNPGDAPLPVTLRWLDTQGRILVETSSVVPGRGSVAVTGDAPEALGAAAIVIESDRPHLAFPVSVGKMAAKSGDTSPRERVIR